MNKYVVPFLTTCLNEWKIKTKDTFPLQNRCLSDAPRTKVKRSHRPPPQEKKASFQSNASITSHATDNYTIDTYLQLLLLPGYPVSAQCNSSIHNSRSLRTRFITFAYITFLAIIGVLIHCLAMHMMTMSAVAFRGRLIWSSSCSLDHGRFSIASGVNVMFITVRLLDEPVSRMLEIEFLKRGESVAKEIPVSTIVQDTHSI
jgi:hypothetical protein